MAETFIAYQGTRQEQYEQLLLQVAALTRQETDLTANMANIAAVLKEQFSWLWIGFYLVKNDQLIVGPFQGPVACTRISRGRGVCGTCWAEERAIIVPDVNQFPGHIACNSRSRSEIVVPVFHRGQVIAVLDADSEQLDTFDATDLRYLTEVCNLLSPTAAGASGTR